MVSRPPVTYVSPWKNGTRHKEVSTWNARCSTDSGKYTETYNWFTLPLALLSLDRPPHDMPVQTQNGGRGVVPSRLRSGAKMKWVVGNKLQPLCSQERPARVSEHVWTAWKTSPLTSTQTPDSKSRSNSLYWLRYPNRLCLRTYLCHKK